MSYAINHQCVENKPRMRICFDPEHEIPKLQSWFAENNHPSRHQVQSKQRNKVKKCIKSNVKCCHGIK